MPKPVIFLAFANDRNDYSRYLRNIPEEYNAIRKILVQAQEKQLCDFEMLPYASFEDIKEVLTRPIFRNRIAIFHFSGHADGLQLMLENQKGENQKAFGQGLIDYFEIIKKDGIQSNLQALFFNGCCTENFALALKNSIPAIIATDNKVDDAQAKSLAVSFYHNICAQIAIGTAFDLAKKERHIEKGEAVSSFYRRKLETEPTSLPWKLQATEEGKNWKLQIIPEKYKPVFLTSPPFDPPVFLGRESELEAVHQKLFAGQNFLMLVNGQGGIGKTSFAARYWKDYQNDYSHLAFLFVGDYLSDTSKVSDKYSPIANALLSLSQELGLKFENETTEEQLQILVKTVSNLQKPCLLILDNANSEKDLNANILILRQCSNFHILMTSRLADYTQAQKHPIGALSKENALAVFKEHYKAFEENEISLFYQIFEAIGGNTLLNELFAKNLNHFNNKLRKKYTLQNLLDDLAKGLTQLSQSKEVHTAYQAKGTGFRNESPEAIILAMYDLTELSENEKAILSVFAVLPAENIAFETLEKFCESENLDQNLLALAQKGWIEYNETAGSFKCNPLVQEITRHKNQNQLFADCEKMIDFLIEKLDYEGSHTTGSTYQEATIYSRYAESVLNVFTEPNRSMSILCERIGIFYQTTGNLQKAFGYFDLKILILEKLCSLEPENTNFKNGLAISYEKLGDVYQAKGDLNKALEYFEKRNKLGEQLYLLEPKNVSFANGLAISYERLGNVYQAKGDLNKALEYFEKYNELSKKLNDLEPKNISFANELAISYERIGSVYKSKGNLNKALEYFEKRNKLGEQLYLLEPKNVYFANGLAISYEKLGSVYTAKGDWNKALEFHNKETIIFEQLYLLEPKNVSFANGLAISYYKLAETHEKLGNIEKAFEYYSQDLKFTEVVYNISPDNMQFRKNLRISYNQMGKMSEKMGKTELAQQYFAKAKEL